MHHRKPIPIDSIEECVYGCGKPARFKSPSGIMMCEDSPNKCLINREKNSRGLIQAHSDRPGGFYSYQHLPQDTKDRMNVNKGKYVADFSYSGKGNHKQVLISERGYFCEECGIYEWRSEKIVLELDHIDGDRNNNVRDNLRLLCPNCHSLTPTWRGRNINTGKSKVSDEDLIASINSSMTIRQALLKVGLAAKGGNYIRCKTLISGGLAKLVETQQT